jgi:aminoglycoside phosphotransferase (APT) family kinase protein
MKEPWERAHPALQLDLSALTQLMRPAFPGRAVVAAERLSGGLANTNYRVVVSECEEAFVVRLYTRSQSSAQKELNVYRLIHDRVPVPEILYTDLDGSRGGCPYAISRWVEGVRLIDLLLHGGAADAAGAGRAVGQVLALIGAYTFPGGGFLAPDLSVDQPFQPGGFLSHMEDRLFQGLAGERIGPRLRDRLWTLIVNARRSIDAAESEATLGHADFNGGNVLVRQGDGAWEVAAVLDWEFAFSGPQLFDVGNMLREEERVDPSFSFAFVEGFSDMGGTLPEDWRRTSMLLDLINLYDFLEAPDASPRVVEDVTQLIHRVVERLEAQPISQRP